MARTAVSMLTKHDLQVLLSVFEGFAYLLVHVHVAQWHVQFQITKFVSLVYFVLSAHCSVQCCKCHSSQCV